MHSPWNVQQNDSEIYSPDVYLFTYFELTLQNTAVLQVYVLGRSSDHKIMTQNVMIMRFLFMSYRPRIHTLHLPYVMTYCLVIHFIYEYNF
jgi:hypothetical protein